MVPVTEVTQQSAYEVKSRNTEPEFPVVTGSHTTASESVDTRNAESGVTESTENTRSDVESCNGWGATHDACEACDRVAAYLADLKAKQEALAAKRAPRFAKYRAEIAQAELERERRRAQHRAERGDEDADALAESESAVAKVLASRRTDDDDDDEYRLLGRLCRRLASDAARTAECCGHCGVDIAPGAPVWRRRLNTGMGSFGSWSWLVGPVCEDCRDDARRRAPRECPGCARPVVDQFHPWRRTAFCCEQCRWSYGNRQRAVDRAARPCESCGEMFTGRPDARFCSNACRQRDYRTRKAATA